MPHTNKSFQRTEEIQAIIERMPDKFGIWITTLVLALVCIIVIISWTVRYPDVVTGEIIINSNISPVRLIANSSGKLFLETKKTENEVNEGDYLAIIENAAESADIVVLKNLLIGFNISDEKLGGKTKLIS